METRASDQSALHYDENFLPQSEAQELLDWLETGPEVHWQREQFSLFGRTTWVPRQLAWYGDSGLNYRYTGLDHYASGWPARLLALKNRISDKTKLPFNFVLLNRYATGAEYMGWHRDDEAAAGPMIASLSLGGARRFRVALHRDGTEAQETEADTTKPADAPAVRSITLGSGSLLTFDGRLRHQLPKTRKHVPVRINLTFRHLSCPTARQK
ncbi:MAG: alpha-ketoglutarate-dependent dioxygenase AlkB [Pseudomonadota bacterium]